VELGRDLVVGQAGGDQAEDLDLAGGEAGGQRGGLGAVGEDEAGVEPGADLVEQPGRGGERFRGGGLVAAVP
jgi:hypothetical protein